MEENNALIPVLHKCSIRVYIILMFLACYLYMQIFRATKHVIQLRVLWLGFSFSFCVILHRWEFSTGDVVWSVEAGLLFIYIWEIPQIGRTLESLWYFASSYH